MDNKAIEALLENPPILPPEKETTGIFKFNETLDSVGLPLESVVYVKRNCKTCYGRGFIRLVVMDGTVGVVFDDVHNVKVKNPERKFRVCDCMNRGYIRARKELEVQKGLASTP